MELEEEFDVTIDDEDAERIQTAAGSHSIYRATPEASNALYERLCEIAVASKQLADHFAS